MKRINIIIGGLICLLICSSCDNFLELTPRDKKVVSSIEDYRDMMGSYMRFLKTPNRSQEIIFGLGVFTFPYFDVTSNLGIYTGETNLDLKLSYIFDKNKSEYTMMGKNLLTWLNTDPYTWNGYYEFLGPINIIISGITKAKGSNENLRNYVKGEALVWRAFSYFKLLQYYAPYKNNKYGIPVFLTPDEDIGNAMPERKTQAEVFKQILADCQEALALLEVTSSNEWNCAWRYDFVNAMMASVYTWKAMSGGAEAADWGNAERCATEAMQGRLLANTPDVLKSMFDCKGITSSTDMQHDEFYFRIMDGDNKQLANFAQAYYSGAGGMVDGLVNPFYYNKFRTGDVRKTIYFNETGTKSDKYNLMGESSGGCIILFRLAEMYLIKAEALVRQGKAGDARGVLEEFERSRYTDAVNIPTDADALLQEILDERTREFYMENDFRWLDMKRLGIKVERTISGEAFVLQPDDFRYCFPIPSKEIKLNKNMEQTPGWDKVIL
ncbi:MAG: RagB/SusD family nutrient uptake outer membrane protein [Odoribacter sp.]